MSLRIQKKQSNLNKDLQLFYEWFADYRGALVEAMFENSDLSVINRQFKRQMFRRYRGNRYFAVTKMNYYRKIALS